MADDGIALVLRRLVRFGCHPRRVGDAAWEAQCPVHRGPYYALLVSRGPDGSVSLNCRYRDFMGRFCPTSELWDSIGLDPREFAGIQVENDPSEGEAIRTVSLHRLRTVMAAPHPATRRCTRRSTTHPSLKGALKARAWTLLRRWREMSVAFRSAKG